MDRRKTRSNRALKGPGRLSLLLALFLTGGLILAAPPSLSCQTVEGHLTDARTGFAVGQAEVELRDSAAMVVARTTTNYLGAFRLAVPGPGRYSLRVEAFGYRSGKSDSFRVREGGVVTMDLSLRPEPVELDTLTVRTRRQQVVVRLRELGFYDRQRQGIGTFLTPEQIRRWPAVNVGDVLRHAPYVHVKESTLQGSIIVIRRYGECEPRIYVDGNPVQDVEGNTPEQWVRPEDIVAVEVYRGEAQIPPQWAQFESCGVILIWTDHLRRGR